MNKLYETSISFPGDSGNECSISMERLEEDGDLLDSYQTDTGNVYSGDSEKRIYYYRSKYYVIDCTHLDCFEYDNYDMAREDGGFNR